jgi:hypothetical protein
LEGHGSLVQAVFDPIAFVPSPIFSLVILLTAEESRHDGGSLTFIFAQARGPHQDGFRPNQAQQRFFIKLRWKRTLPSLGCCQLPVHQGAHVLFVFFVGF